MISPSLLLLEIGNSTIKAAHALDDGSIAIERFSNLEAFLRRSETGDEDILCLPVGRGMSDMVIERLREMREIRVMEREDLRAFVGDSYATPETLGLDRIVNLLGLEQDGLVISCGTAITIDALWEGRPYWGAIMPGFRTAADGVHERIPALPQLALNEPVGFPSRNSVRSVANGVLLGTARGAEALAEELFASITGAGKIPSIVVTGGDAELLLRLWGGSEIPAVDEALLFRGMMKVGR